MHWPNPFGFRHATYSAVRAPSRSRRLVVGAAAAACLAAPLSLVTAGVAGASLSNFTVPAQTPAAIVPGNTATFAPITVNDSNGLSSDSVKLTSSTLPSGATFSDSADGTNGCVMESSSTYTFNNVGIVTTGSVSPTTGTSFTLTASRYGNSNCSGSPNSTATGSGTLVVQPAASSGNGTMGVSPTTAIASSTGNNLTFSFTAPSNGSFGTNSYLTLAIPSGWTTPQTTNSGNAGYVTTTAGTCTLGSTSVLSSTITVPMACGENASFTLSYTNVTAGSSVGTATFTTSTHQGSGGTATAIASQPTVTVQAAATSGQGTMTVSPTAAIVSSTGNNLAFTFTAPSMGGYGNGSEVTLAIPTGTGTAWTTPQTTNSGNPGFVSTTAGTCTLGTASVASSTITVPMVCPASGSFTINYANATARTTTGPSTFTTQTRQGTGALVGISTSPTVTVQPAATSGQGAIAVAPTTTTAGSSGNNLTFNFHRSLRWRLWHWFRGHSGHPFGLDCAADGE